MLLSNYLYTLIGDWLFTLQHRWQQTLIDQLSGSSPKKSKKTMNALRNASLRIQQPAWWLQISKWIKTTDFTG
jgi:hypothetical protein